MNNHLKKPDTLIIPRKTLFTQLNRKELLIGIAILTLALFVRLVYLYESSANPSFGSPIVDSETYNNAARSLAAGKGMSNQFFWQPFFYPLFLAAVYSAGNSSIIFAKFVQLLLGCVTCLLTYHLGGKIFDRRTGAIAAIITALYGPLVFFEAELLASGWAALWSVVLILLFLKTSSKKSVSLCLILGICGALSIITRPTFVPFFAAAVVWLAIIFYRDHDRWLKFALRLAAISTGFLLITIPVAAQNLRITGHFGILPSSGGINFYIGNNPNYAQTLTARPGWGWEEIVSLPEQNGVTGDMWEKQKFYKQKVINYVLTQPFAFAKGLAYKTIQFLNSREIPRNVDVYLFTKWSRLLGLLVWKVGGFGFPFGVLLPLALVGVVTQYRQLPVPLLLFMVLYPLSIILVFVSARYRVPAIPLTSIIAAAGLLNLFRIVRDLYWSRIAVISISVVGTVLLSSLPGPFPEEKPNYEAELYRNVAVVEKKQGKINLALAHLNKALEITPDYPSANVLMGIELAKTGKIDKAIAHFRQALQTKPYYVKAHKNLGVALQEQGKLDQALYHYHLALEIRPDAETNNNLAGLFYSQGKLDQAIKHFNEAILIDPTYSKSHNGLGAVFLKQGKLDKAIACFNKALELKADYPDAHYNMGLAMARRGKYEKAIKHFNRVLQEKPHWARLLNDLGLAYTKLGKYDLAIQSYSEALRIKPDYLNAHYNLANTYYKKGIFDLAVEHWTETIELKPDFVEVLTNLAWVLATTKDPKIHNPNDAVKYAQKACQLTDYKQPTALDRLAVAYAAAGKFPEAVETAEKASKLAGSAGKKELSQEIRDRLRLYHTRQPYHQP